LTTGRSILKLKLAFKGKHNSPNFLKTVWTSAQHYLRGENMFISLSFSRIAVPSDSTLNTHILIICENSWTINGYELWENLKCINLITQQHTFNIWKSEAQMKDSISQESNPVKAFMLGASN